MCQSNIKYQLHQRQRRFKLLWFGGDVDSFVNEGIMIKDGNNATQTDDENIHAGFSVTCSTSATGCCIFSGAFGYSGYSLTATGTCSESITPTNSPTNKPSAHPTMTPTDMVVSTYTYEPSQPTSTAAISSSKILEVTRVRYIDYENCM